MAKIVVSVADLRGKSGSEAVDDLAEFLKEKLGAEVEVSGDEVSLGFGEEKGGKGFSRSRVRMLLRKFLHKTELKEDFRVIAGKEGSLIVKEKKIAEAEE